MTTMTTVRTISEAARQRLQKEKQENEKRDHEQGYLAGFDWAEQDGYAVALAGFRACKNSGRLQEATSLMEVMGRTDEKYFRNTGVDLEACQRPAYLRGFIEGALAVWDQV